MATLSGTLKAFGSKWYPRLTMKASKAFGFVPYEITGPTDASSPTGFAMHGVIWINKATLVGAGGSILTITDDSSTVVVTE